LTEYRARSNIKARKFKSLLEGEVQELKHIWDSDDDLADDDLKVGDSVD
jgi:hypothetical protein